MSAPTVAQPPERPRRAPAWIVLIATVVIAAALQAATAVPGLGTASGGVFLAQLLGSLAVVVAQLCVLTWAASALVRRVPLGRVRASLVLWSMLAVFVLLASVVVTPIVLPLMVAVVCCVLPVTAVGQGNALRGFGVFRRTPGRAVAVTLVTLVLAVVSWLVALLSGFFLTGALGAFAGWLWSGLTAAFLLWLWTRLAARAGVLEAAAAPDTGDAATEGLATRA